MASKNQARAALDVLAQGHDRIRALIREFHQQEQHKERAVEDACGALSTHIQLEEMFFYPAIEGAIGDAQLVEEARVELDTIKQLISKLQSGMLDAAARDATFAVMTQLAERHIEREERVLFDKVRASSLDLSELGQTMAAEKAKLEKHPVLTRGQHSQPRGAPEHSG